MEGLPPQPLAERVQPLIAAVAADRTRPTLQGRFAEDVEQIVAYIGDAPTILLNPSEDEVIGLCARLLIAAALTCPLVETLAELDVPVEIWVAERISALIESVQRSERVRTAGLLVSDDAFNLDDVAEVGDVLRGLEEQGPRGRDYSLIVYVCTEMAADLFRLSVVQNLDIGAVLAAHDELLDAANYVAGLLQHPYNLDISIQDHPGDVLFHLISIATKMGMPGDPSMFVPEGHDPRAYRWARIGMSAFWCCTMRLPASWTPDVEALWRRAHALAAEILAASGGLHDANGFQVMRVAERIRGHALEVVCSWLDTAIDKDGPLRRESDVDRMIEVIAYSLIGIRLDGALDQGV